MCSFRLRGEQRKEIKNNQKMNDSVRGVRERECTDRCRSKTTTGAALEYIGRKRV